jgi:hypothetical protein
MNESKSLGGCYYTYGEPAVLKGSRIDSLLQVIWLSVIPIIDRPNSFSSSVICKSSTKALEAASYLPYWRRTSTLWFPDRSLWLVILMTERDCIIDRPKQFLKISHLQIINFTFRKEEENLRMTHFLSWMMTVNFFCANAQNAYSIEFPVGSFKSPSHTSLHLHIRYTALHGIISLWCTRDAARIDFLIWLDSIIDFRDDHVQSWLTVESFNWQLTG